MQRKLFMAGLHCIEKASDFIGKKVRGYKGLKFPKMHTLIQFDFSDYGLVCTSDSPAITKQVVSPYAVVRFDNVPSDPYQDYTITNAYFMTQYNADKHDTLADVYGSVKLGLYESHIIDVSRIGLVVEFEYNGEKAYARAEQDFKLLPHLVRADKILETLQAIKKIETFDEAFTYYMQHVAQGEEKTVHAWFADPNVRPSITMGVRVQIGVITHKKYGSAWTTDLEEPHAKAYIKQVYEKGGKITRAPVIDWRH